MTESQAENEVILERLLERVMREALDSLEERLIEKNRRIEEAVLSADARVSATLERIINLMSSRGTSAADGLSFATCIQTSTQSNESPSRAQHVIAETKGDAYGKEDDNVGRASASGDDTCSSRSSSPRRPDGFEVQPSMPSPPRTSGPSASSCNVEFASEPERPVRFWKQSDAEPAPEGKVRFDALVPCSSPSIESVRSRPYVTPLHPPSAAIPNTVGHGTMDPPHNVLVHSASNGSLGSIIKTPSQPYLTSKASRRPSLISANVGSSGLNTGRRVSSISMTSLPLSTLSSSERPRNIFSLDEMVTDVMLESQFDELLNGSSSPRSIDLALDPTLDQDSGGASSMQDKLSQRRSVDTRKLNNMESLRVVQEETLLNECELASTASIESCIPTVLSQRVTFKPLRMLQLFGVLSLRVDSIGTYYHRFLTFTFAMVSLYSLLASRMGSDFHYLRLSVACYSFGSMLALIYLRRENVNNLIGPGNKTLDRCAQVLGFLDEWQSSSLRLFGLVVALWCCVLVSGGRLTFSCLSISDVIGLGELPLQICAFVSVALSTGLYIAVGYCQLHICCSLELMVDKFCIRFFEEPDLHGAVREWNILQATLRRAANTVEKSLFATQTSVLVAMVLFFAELLAGDGVPFGDCGLMWLLFVLPMVLLAFLVLFRAAIVTEKCSRVPPLINTMRFEGSPINFEQQYVVNYIQHSDAGFYVKGVRLTTFMVLKLTYVFGVAAFAAVTRL